MTEPNAKIITLCAPVTLAPLPVAPHAYYLYTTPRRCRHCGTLSETSELYALTFLRNRTGTGHVKNLRPIDRLEWNIPFKQQTFAMKEVALCSACSPDTISARLADLPTPPIPDAILNTLGVATAGFAGTPQGRKAPKTIDDILGML